MRFFSGNLNIVSDFYFRTWVGTALDSLCSKLLLVYHTQEPVDVLEEVEFFVL